MKGKGPKLSPPRLPLPTPLEVQMRAATGLCITSTFSMPARNDEKRFKARSD